METIGLTDIIGPVMVGPSSSHTAGALRIAYMARKLAGALPAHVEFRLLGSFAHTLTGHGTDKALVAGMLGFAPDDLRIRNSFAHAREAGLDFNDYEHPNTIDIVIDTAEGGHMEVRGESVGGGAAVIRKIDGVEDVQVSFMTQKLTLVADDARFDEIVREMVKVCRKVEPDCEIVLK